MITVFFEGSICDGRTQWRGTEGIELHERGVIINDELITWNRIVRVSGWRELTALQSRPVSVVKVTPPAEVPPAPPAVVKTVEPAKPQFDGKKRR